MIEKTLFGCLPDGRQVHMYTIRNCWGEYVELLDFGACIHSVFVPDRDGCLGDVVLGVTRAEELAQRSVEGTMIGRVGNRIKAGKCVLDGREVQLEKNVRGNFLHGASGNYAFRMFDGQPEPDGQTVRFYCKDTGEGGWNDNVDVWMSYTFDDDHKLTLHYLLIPEALTVLSPTNHVYFNLGDFGDIRDHQLIIHADCLAQKGELAVPDGRTLRVDGTPFDFRQPRTIREGIDSDQDDWLPQDKRGYDDFYVLPGKGMRLAAQLYCPDTGRRLNTYTDQQSLVFFTPTNCSTRPGKRGVTYPDYAGICLETQYVPNAVNCPEFDSPVFRPGEKMESWTIYEFLAEGRS